MPGWGWNGDAARETRVGLCVGRLMRWRGGFAAGQRTNKRVERYREGTVLFVLVRRDAAHGTEGKVRGRAGASGVECGGARYKMRGEAAHASRGVWRGRAAYATRGEERSGDAQETTGEVRDVAVHKNVGSRQGCAWNAGAQGRHGLVHRWEGVCGGAMH